MYIATIALILALGASVPTAATEAQHVPSSPSTWPDDFVARIEPTLSCPGGTPESLRKRMHVSAAFNSPLAYQAAVQDELPALTGMLPGDAFHQFHFRADLPGGGYWGFGGYAVVRAGCIVHAEITSHDN